MIRRARRSKNSDEFCCHPLILKAVGPGVRRSTARSSSSSRRSGFGSVARKMIVDVGKMKSIFAGLKFLAFGSTRQRSPTNDTGSASMPAGAPILWTTPPSTILVVASTRSSVSRGTRHVTSPGGSAGDSPRNRSGNVRREEKDFARGFRGATAVAPNSPTSGTKPWRPGGDLCRSLPLQPPVGACTTCREMFGSGAKIATNPASRIFRTTDCRLETGWEG